MPEQTKKLDLKNPSPGAYYGVSFEDYVEITAVNNSVLKILCDQSPAHARWYMDNGRPDTQALSFGSAADMFILEPTLFAKNYVVAPVDEEGKDYRRNSKVWKEFALTVPEGVEILKKAEMDDILSIYNCLSGSPAMALLRGGFSQIVLIWKDEKTGLICKGRLDYWNKELHCITDFKTTRDAKPENFAKDMFKYKYFMQGAFYTDGFCLATGEEVPPSFCFFATEKVAPYIHSAFELGELSLEAGRVCYREALDLYAKCLKNNHWPMYREGVTMIEMPDWALATAGIGPHNPR